MEGECWSPRFVSVAAERVVVRRVGVAQIFRIDGSIWIQSLREAQLHGSSSYASDMKTHYANHILSHVEDGILSVTRSNHRHVNWGDHLPTLNGCVWLSRHENFSVSVIDDDRRPAQRTTRRRGIPACHFKQGIVRFPAVDLGGH